MLKDADQDQFILSFVGMTSREVDHFLATKFGCEESPDHISPAKDKVIKLVGSSLLLGSRLNPEVNGSDSPRNSKIQSKNQVKQPEIQSQESQVDADQNGQDVAHIKREKRYNFRFSGGEDLKNKIQRAKEVLSHKYPKGQLENLLGAALDELLTKHAPEHQKSRSRIKQINTQSRYIPRSLRREVFADAGYCCEAVSQSGVRCGAKHYLEVDHLLPIALGGRTERSNLQILCKAHNLHKARTQLGTHFIHRKILENRGG
jgi:5-methylcytosine-specific restriction endonuclease McrA